MTRKRGERNVDVTCLRMDKRHGHANAQIHTFPAIVKVNVGKPAKFIIQAICSSCAGARLVLLRV
jgi:hypothetical protein